MGGVRKQVVILTEVFLWQIMYVYLFPTAKKDISKKKAGSLW